MHTKFRRDISIHGWDITTSGLWKQTSAMLEFYFRFRFLRFASPSACHSASAYQISSKSDHPRRSYDVISIFQDGGHGIAISFPVSVFVIWLISEGRNILAYQISAGYLNPRLSYNYFRFLKTNGRHSIILLPVPIFTFALISACLFYLSTEFRPNRTIRDGVMTLYSFFKMAAVSHIELFQGYCRPPTKFKWRSQVGPAISTRSDL